MGWLSQVEISIDPSIHSPGLLTPKEQMSCVIGKWLPLGQF